MDGAEGDVTAPDQGVDSQAAVSGTGDQPDTGGTTETPPQAWDWSEHADQHVSVKVGAEERLVPLREAVDGYMRQADYTQKTQTLSDHARQLSWAQTIAEALEQDPEQAINILQSQYLGNQDQQQEEFLTDEERQIAELNEWRQQQEQAQAVQQVEAEAAYLQQTFGDEFFDPQELVEYAIQGNFPNLTSALQSMKFSEVYGEAKAVRDARAQQEQQQAADEEARRQAALVGGGHNVSAGSTQRGTPGERLTVREAFERALADNQ